MEAHVSPIYSMHGVVRFGHAEADLVKILRNLRVPSTRCLLKAVEWLLESAYSFQMGA